MNKVVAIDGPAGSGKGTITKIVADKLNLVTIDTGATYRCIALATLKRGLTLDDTEEIIKLSSSVKIDMTLDGKVYLDGEDVTHDIRTKEVTQIVSPLSSIIEVRKNMVNLQRELAKGKDVIMEGRDITTVVFPNADYKFYLDASEEERAKRRYKQNQETGIDMSYEEILENIRARDYNDMHKEYGALVRTDEQIYIDSSNMTIDEVANKIINIVEGE